jgi:hypothetical protein
LIVRIGFILGNLTSRHDNARVLFLKEKYSLDTLIKTLKVYFDLDQVRKESYFCLLKYKFFIFKIKIDIKQSGEFKCRRFK